MNLLHVHVSNHQGMHIYIYTCYVRSNCSLLELIHIPLQILMSLVKLGVITLLLSDSLVSGYTAAAAFTILVTQIKFLFGLDPEEAFVKPGVATTPRVRHCCDVLPYT